MSKMPGEGENNESLNRKESWQTAPQRHRSVLPALIGFILLALFVIGIAGAAWFYQLRKKQAPPPPPIIGHVSAPTLTDENGTSFSISQLEGRIWVVDFIFTRCGGQCPVMSMNMHKLQEWLSEKEHGNVKLVSVSVDPEFDSPEVMKRYAKRFKADENRWSFLTGDRTTIYDYMLKDFHLGSDKNAGKPVSEMFIHSDKLILIDRERNIRGYFSGTDPEDMEKLRTAIEAVSYETSPPEPTPAEPTPIIIPD